ncbi:MAG TPA: 4-alpha-glucanotransferase [Anaerolineae bacterium]|nr:4-alpha-glucanotransferase [Anaerolineae bacterium]
MTFDRASGVLLHPTSFPGPDGIGDLGPEAYRWIDFLSSAGCALWQVLPLGPTGYGDSPYQCFSAFAGNPYLISPDLLLKENLLVTTDIADRPQFPIDRVDFGPAITWKLTLLDRAYRRFRIDRSKQLREEFALFQIDQSSWLDDFSIFMALKEAHQSAWGDWPKALRQRDPQALQAACIQHADSIEKHAFRQFLFFRQWSALRTYAHTKKIKIVGDIPIFVAYDSADVWSQPELFYLNSRGQPTVVAGVPPDYFAPTGQLWGNPLYRWAVHQRSGYAWWLERLRATFRQVDIARLDHFRGFAGYWGVPADQLTAEKGKWTTGPGKIFFKAIQRALGELPIIAEDLGEITPDVIELRDAFDLPGMKILQFAFNGASPLNPFLPHRFPVNCVVYTGTHDNDTIRGWYASASEREREFALKYLNTAEGNLSVAMIRAAWSSVANMALASMQDLLDLDGSARMNFPGRESGNWGWRMRADALTFELRDRVKELNILYGRVNPAPG